MDLSGLLFRHRRKRARLGSALQLMSLGQYENSSPMCVLPKLVVDLVQSFTGRAMQFGCLARPLFSGLVAPS
eukprot:3815102-Amphidinium_carterae.1